METYNDSYDYWCNEYNYISTFSKYRVTTLAHASVAIYYKQNHDYTIEKINK